MKDNKEKKRGLFRRPDTEVQMIEPQGDLPFVIERKLKGYTTFMLLFLAFGVFSFAFTKSVFICAFGVLLAVAVYMLGRFQRAKILSVGYEFWDMVVIEHTFLTRLQKRPTGMYLRAENGPYAGRICHLALTAADVVPASGQRLRVCVPSDAEASLIRDVYYIPQYYGVDFLNDDY